MQYLILMIIMSPALLLALLLFRSASKRALVSLTKERLVVPRDLAFDVAEAGANGSLVLQLRKQRTIISLTLDAELRREFNDGKANEYWKNKLVDHYMNVEQRLDALLSVSPSASELHKTVERLHEDLLARAQRHPFLAAKYARKLSRQIKVLQFAAIEQAKSEPLLTVDVIQQLAPLLEDDEQLHALLAEHVPDSAAPANPGTD